MNKPLKRRRKKIPMRLKQEAFNRYLEGRLSIQEIADCVGVSSNTVSKWASNGNWRDRKAKTEEAIMQNEQRAIKLFIAQNRPRIVEQQIETCDKIHGKIADILDSNEPTTPAQLLTITRAHQANAAVQVKSAGIDKMHDDQQKGGVNIGSILVNVQPAPDHVGARLDSCKVIDVEEE